MARAILITAGQVTAEGQLNDSKTARAIWDALPIEAKGETKVFKTVRAGARVTLRRAA